MWNVTFRARRFFLPTVAKTDAGYFLDVEPVYVVSAEDTPGLEAALGEVIARGNPRIPAPIRAEFPKPVVLGPAGVKSWSTFERKSVCWTITREGRDYMVSVTGRAPNGKWANDPAKTTIAGDLGPSAIVALIMQQLKFRTDV